MTSIASNGATRSPVMSIRSLAISVADIGTAHVLKILEPIWKDKPETASRVRGRIETVLMPRRRADTGTAKTLPAGAAISRKSSLPARVSSRGHHKAMPYECNPGIHGELRERGAMAALALEFADLTATRTSEVLGATWAEVDLGQGRLDPAASRMKAGKEHRVPLRRALSKF